MRILLLGEYSNVHYTLAQGLRRLGHEVVLASNGDFWKDYPRDIDLQRSFGVKGNASFLWRLIKALPRMRGFDVVQMINPMFLEVKAERIFPIYRYLRRHNRKVVLGAFGMDYYWVKDGDSCALRYSDFNLGKTLRQDEAAKSEREDWLGTTKERLNKYIASDCDGIVAGLYEYYHAYEEYSAKMQFIPYPVEVTHTEEKSAENRPAGGEGKLRIFIGISKSRSRYKGTDIMLEAAQRLRSNYPDRVELKIANGVPFKEYQNMMDNSDCLLDQLYGYTPAMNALLALSKGIVVVGGGEPENYAILGEEELRPIVNVCPVPSPQTGDVDFGMSVDSCYRQLENLVLNPEQMPRLKAQSKEYIRRYHDADKVARKYEQFYKKL